MTRLRAWSFGFKQSLWRLAVFFVTGVLLFGFYPVFPVEAQGQPGTLLVKLAPSASEDVLPGLASEVELLFDRVYRLRVSDKQAARAYFSAHQLAEFVEEDQVLRTQLNTNDPLFVLDQNELSKQWYLSKIQIHKAWEKTLGAPITVAVIDTGINARHEDLNDGRVVKGYMSFCQVMNTLQPNDCLLRASGELAPGVNSDDNGHGTIVAGIIGAIPNNQRGIAGINWHVRLMPVKALDNRGSGLASDVALGIRWAADNGAKIINLSIGGPGLQGLAVLQEAISYAFNKGALIVAAGGNDAAETGGSLNSNPVLPVCADGGQNMVVGVAAVDINDKKARFSNFGSDCIDVAAPGTGTFLNRQQKQGLVSTYYDPTRPGEHDLYVYAVGTSVAAPIVSGTASLLMAAFPDLDVKAVRERLIGSVDNIDQQNQDGCNGSSCVGQLGRGRVNAFKAVTLDETFASGTLVRDPQGNLFLVERGLKRPISEFVYSQRFAALSPVVNATTEQLSGFPAGEAVSPADGTLIKEPNNPTVYLMEDGLRRGLSYAAFISRGFRFEQAVVLSQAEVFSYPLGGDASVLNGVLLKALDHPAVYILHDSGLRLLSFFVFQQRGFNNQPLAELSQAELAQFPVPEPGFLYPPLEGTLIRGDLVPTVYLIEGGRRRGLTLAAFQSRGFSFSNVRVVPQSEAEGYEQGLDILE